MTTTAVDPRGVAPSQLIAREIRAEMGRQQLSGRRLALMVGKPPMWVNRRLTLCDVPLTAEDVQLFADALKVPTTRLLTGWLPRMDSNHQPAEYATRLRLAA